MDGECALGPIHKQLPFLINHEFDLEPETVYQLLVSTLCYIRVAFQKTNLLVILVTGTRYRLILESNF